MARLGPQDARVWVDGMDLRERGFLTRLEHGDEASYETERVFGKAHSRETPTGRIEYMLAIGGYFHTSESLRRLVGSTNPTDIVSAVFYSDDRGAAVEFAGSLEIRSRNIVTPPDGLVRIDVDLEHGAGDYFPGGRLIFAGEVAGDHATEWVDIGNLSDSKAIIMIDGGDGFSSTSRIRVDLSHNTSTSGNGFHMTTFRLDMAAGESRAAGIFTRSSSNSRYIRANIDWDPDVSPPKG